MKYLSANRFIISFIDLKINFDAAVGLDELYCSMLGVNIIEIENASKLLQKLYFNYEISIATNDPKKLHNKLAK